MRYLAMTPTARHAAYLDRVNAVCDGCPVSGAEALLILWAARQSGDRWVA